MDCKMARLQLWKESRGEGHSIPHENRDYTNQGRLKYILTIIWIHVAFREGHNVSKRPPCTSVTRVTTKRPWFDHPILSAIWRLRVLRKLSLTGHMMYSIPVYLKKKKRNPIWSALAGIYFRSAYRVATEAIQVCIYNLECGGRMFPM